VSVLMLVLAALSAAFMAPMVRRCRVLSYCPARPVSPTPEHEGRNPSHLRRFLGGGKNSLTCRSHDVEIA
ncbi:MAG: hypothetical protein L0J64_12475, partial [Corynebacterium sp.]|uniref:hypothetical protein n=1 Tax=Corynebacterium sp. TaxID=1720 RepID=UPI002648E7EB